MNANVQTICALKGNPIEAGKINAGSDGIGNFISK